MTPTRGDGRSGLRSTLARVGVALLVVGLVTSAVAPFAATAADQTTVEGTVTDVDTGSPVENATVEVLDSTGTVQNSTETNASGWYEIDTSGGETLRVSASGYDTQTRDIASADSYDFELGTTPRYEFVLQPGEVYAVAIPGQVEATTIADLFDRIDFDGVVYTYDASADAWEQVVLSEGRDLSTFDAMVVVVDDAETNPVEMTVEFNGTAGVDEGSPPSEQLSDGWNFVAPNQSNVTAAFADAEQILDQGFAEPETKAGSPQIEGEDDFERHNISESGAPRVNPFKGYFVRTSGGGEVTAEAYDGITRTAADALLGLGNGTLEGQVLDTAGDPIGGATVNVESRDGHFTAETHADASGNYHIGDVPAGATDITVTTDGYNNGQRTVAVRVLETATANVTLEPWPTISGAVTDNKTAEGIENATVVAVSQANGEEVDRSATNATGSYALTVPENATYNVSVETADHVDETNRSVSVQQDDVTSENFSLDPLDGSITGTVTDSKNGTGIQGVEVTVVDTTESSRSYNATTDENGSYEIGGIEPHEEYDLSVTAIDHADANRTINVSANETRTEDFALRPLNGSIRGTITDDELSSDDAIAGAEVTVTDENGTAVGTNTTASDGSYSVDAVPASENVTIAVTAPDHVDDNRTLTLSANETRTGEDFALVPENATINGTLTDNETSETVGEGVLVTVVNSTSGDNVTTVQTSADGTYTASVPAHDTYDVIAGDGEKYVAETQPDVTVGAGDDYKGGGETVDFTLDPNNGTFGGTVTDAELQQDDSIDSVTVSLESQDGSVSRSAQTNETGDYVFLDLPAQKTYNLTFERSDYRTNETTGVALGPGDDVTVDVALDPKNGSIGGTVTDSNTTDTLANVTVALVSQDGVVDRTNLTDANGSYVFSDLPAQKTYDLNFSKDGYAANNSSVAVGPDEDVTLNVSLDPLGFLSGTVREDDGVDITRSANATVTLLEDGVVVTSTQTNGDGEYVTESVGSGTYTVRAGKDGFTPSEKEVVIEEGENAGENFLITQRGSINGTVTDVELSSNDTIINATVAIQNGTAGVDRVLETDDAGTYNATGLPTEFEYNVTATNGDHFPVSVNVSLNAGESNVSDFELEPRNTTIVGVIDDNVTEEGIENVTVAVESTETDGTLDPQPVFTNSTETDENGNYRLVVEPHLEYEVSVTAADHEDPANETVQVGAGEAYKGGGASVSLSLTPLNGTIEGSVTDAESGDPVDGASVSVTDAESGTEVGNVTTDANGAYAVADLDPHSEYEVIVMETDYVDAGPRLVSLGANETNETNFSLSPQDGTINGSLTDSATGEGIANATVIARNASDDITLTTVTEENGSFTIEDVPARKTYQVNGSDEDYVFDENDSNHLAEVTPGPNETVSVQIQIDPQPATVTGTVTDAKLADDPDHDAGIGGVNVTVSDANDLISGNSNSTTTAAAGTYSVEVPADGTEYEVQFAATNHTDNTSGTFTPDANETVRVDDSLEPLNGSVNGTIVDDSTGDPIEGIYVNLDSQDSEYSYTVQTDAEGNYAFPTISGLNEIPEPPGSENYRILVGSVSDNYASDKETFLLGANEDRTQNFSLEPLDGTISGNVTDADTGDAIAGAEVVAVNVSDASDKFHTTTDGKGSYELNVTSPATYNVTVTATDYEPSTQEVTVNSGESVTQDFGLQAKNGTVEGTVTSNATGESLGGVNVTVTSEETDTFGSPVFEETVSTTTDGTYTVENVPANANYTVGFAGTDYADETSEVFVVGPNETVVKDRALEPLNGTISGTVVDNKTGDAVAGATVEAKNTSDGITVTTTTADDGTYTIDSVPAERNYTVRVTDAVNHSTPSEPKSIIVDANEDLTGVNFSIDPLPSTVQGEVRNASDESLITDRQVNVTVHRLDDSGNVVEQDVANATTSDGSYEIGGLDPYEDYRVIADAENFLSDDGNVSVGANETATQNLSLQPSGYVTGEVVEDGSFDPIEGATVEIIDVDTSIGGSNETVATATTDSSGRYTTNEVATGDYTISFDADGYQPTERSITIAQGENGPEDAYLNPE